MDCFLFDKTWKIPTHYQQDCYLDFYNVIKKDLKYFNLLKKDFKKQYNDIKLIFHSDLNNLNNDYKFSIIIGDYQYPITHNYHYMCSIERLLSI